MNSQNGHSKPALPNCGYVSAEVLASAGCYLVDSERGAEMVGKLRDYRAGVNFAGLAFPYYLPGHANAVGNRLRRDKAQLNGAPKYLSAPGQRNHFYVHPQTPAAWPQDASVSVIFTEGELKTLALYQFFQARGERICAIGLPGVWSWRGVIEVERGATDGHVIERKRGAIADFDSWNWRGRRVELLFDPNVKTNPSVATARARLTRELQSRGAEVFWIEWPDDLPAECNGADDYLTAFSEAAFARLLEVGRREAGAVLLKLTDAEFLNRFAEDYGEFFVYVEDWGRWGAWRGARWDFEHGIADLWAQIPALAQEICEQEKDTAIFDPKKFSAFCKRYQMRDGINAIRAMAECDRRFRRSVAQFDAQPWLLNCANGTLDLTTGELKAPEPGDYIRQQAPTAWNPEAACPKFEQFLQVTAQGSQSWIDYLQQVLGYCLTGDNGAQAIWVLHGNSGQNGKSVLLKTMAGVLGPDYVKTIDAAAFMPRFNAAGHDDKLASVGGCRLLVISEPDEGQRLDMGVIKRITGDSEIRVSFKGQRNFVLPITFKGILVCNELPEMRQVDGGTWRRWKPIPFLNRISDEERIDRLEEILLTEREGILAWCVRGLHDYLENGCRFREPASTTDAAKEYRESSDDLQAFISECCNVADGLSGSSTALHQAYLAFNGKRAKYQSARAFTQAMFNKGFGRRKTNHGRYITGLALAASDNDENSE